MASPMSPSDTITKGQCGKFADVQIDALVKSGLPSELTQQVLETQGGVLADEFVAAVRKRVEAISELIVRHVRVDRSRTNEQAIRATGRVEHVNKDALATMPRGGNEEEDIYFCPIARNATPAEVAETLKRHGIEPDPAGVAKVNEDDPAFADQHPNACQWQDAQGRWTYVAFYRWSGERGVSVYRFDSGWRDGWWFGGRKVSA